MTETTRKSASNAPASMVYRGADGRPHIVQEQEQAARDAQRSDAQQPGIQLNLARRSPD